MALALLSALWGLPPVLAADLSGPPAPSSVTGDRALRIQTLLVRVSAEGRVDDIRYETEAPEPLKRLLTAAVAQWRFAPYRREGRPLDWYTKLHVGLTGIPQGDGSKMGLKIASVAMSNRGRPEFMAPPRYPPEMMKRRKGAIVCLDIDIDEEGLPLSSVAISVNGSSPKKNDPFAEAAKNAAREWKFGALEVDGKRYGIAERIRLPMKFTPDARDTVEIPADACTKLDGQDAAPKLLSEPVGKML